MEPTARYDAKIEFFRNLLDFTLRVHVGSGLKHTDLCSHKVLRPSELPETSLPEHQLTEDGSGGSVYNPIALTTALGRFLSNREAS